MENIKRLYETTELTLQQIADHTSTSYKQVFNFVARRYSREHRTERKRNSYSKSKTGLLNPMYCKMGNEHHNYVGVVGDSKGYLMELKPAGYTGRVRSKHVFQHHIVVCAALELTAVPAGWCVHHVDGNPHNNEFDNLVLMTLSDHQRLHQVLAGATTISKESTLKWVEAQGTPYTA